MRSRCDEIPLRASVDAAVPCTLPRPVSGVDAKGSLFHARPSKVLLYHIDENTRIPAILEYRFLHGRGVIEIVISEDGKILTCSHNFNFIC